MPSSNPVTAAEAAAQPSILGRVKGAFTGKTGLGDSTSTIAPAQVESQSTSSCFSSFFQSIGNFFVWLFTCFGLFSSKGADGAAARTEEASDDEAVSLVTAERGKAASSPSA